MRAKRCAARAEWGEGRPAAIGAAGLVLDHPLMVLATAVQVPGGGQHYGVRPARSAVHGPDAGQAGARRP